ncbi:unnamed protein product, partial [Rotaria sp. Silwood1]
FNTVPGGNLSANLSVLSYHWYCTTLSIGLPIPVTLPPGVTLLTTGTTCNIQGDLIFQAVDNDITQTRGSSFLTEFGFDGRTNTGAQQNDYVLDKSDQYFQSWTVWGQSFINESNNIQYDILSQFNRPYAYAIAGTPLFMFYDRNDPCQVNNEKMVILMTIFPLLNHFDHYHVWFVVNNENIVIKMHF